ncbi:aspartate 1-decarboxylase [Lentibacillus amyloliquefaciens]|uniref:Aspartate 1-decarboxylase n=1 Tax=Lentibacillus amyloliquefaciens TaxID=1472767 RepID=A0A0U3WJ99_9BACI|nr:aspartate 1-decarboxylase [Lentibacillus amyloliquefaciens]ALX49951.1 L-aspartate 1-decarboxylase [Lentibacillus amyloliquefaciens]
MQRLMCKGKLHRVRVTEADLDYVGSITIDSKFMKEADIKPYEMVQITNLKNATRWKTYALPAPEGSKRICLNGPPAHLFSPGDIVIILSMAQMSEEEIKDWKPRVVFFDENNEITSIKEDNLNWPEEASIQ